MQNQCHKNALNKKDNLQSIQYIEKYRNIIWKQIKDIVKDTESTVEIYQETVRRFLTVYNKLDKTNEWMVLCYIKAIAKYAAYEYCRKRRREYLIPDMDCYPTSTIQDVETLVVNKVMYETVRQEILQMDETYSAPLLLRVQQNLSYKEIGKLLGISEQNARVRVHRARELLRKNSKLDWGDKR